MDPNTKITVLLADDHTVIREGLRMLLDTSGDIRVVAEADNGLDAIRVATDLRPDVVVLDLAMPQVNGVEATKQILKSVPETKVLILSTYGMEDCVDKAVQEGAVGYLIKQTASQELIKAIREARKGNHYFSPAISKRFQNLERESFLRNGQQRKETPRLTTRETEVLRLIAAGHANKQIADSLNISIKTVEKHRQQMMAKLNIHEVATLTRYAISKGLVADPAVNQPA
jgi:DNA-binding NarL/FixJ family response regulator